LIVEEVQQTGIYVMMSVKKGEARRREAIRHCKPGQAIVWMIQVESSLREMTNREFEGAMELNQGIKG
jgi:hypothetical protein